MARLAEQPDVTMPGLADMLWRDRGVRVHAAALSDIPAGWRSLLKTR